MREMKDSGIPWIGKIPKDWKVCPLKYLCSYNNETLPENTNSEYEFDYVDIGSVTYGKGIENYQHLKFSKAPSRARRLVKKGDVILSTVRTYLKATAQIPENVYPIVVSTGYLTLRANKQIIPNFLKYSVQQDAFISEIEAKSSGVSYPAINAIEAVRTNVIVPPIYEQQRIADYLDSKCAKIDSIRKNVEAAIEALKQYKKSVITEAVTKGLDKNVEMKDSGIPWIGKIPKHWKIHPVYFYFNARKHRNSLGKEKNLLSLSYGKIIEKDINQVGGLLPESFNTYNIVESGDIIIRPTDLQNDKRSLRTGLVKEHGIITSAYIDLMSIRPVNTVYYHYLLHTYDVMKVFYNMGNGVRQGLNFSEFSHLMLFEPTVKEQQQIADYLDSKCSKIDSIIQKKQEVLQDLDTYKKSLIYEYVTGKKEVSAV